MAGTVVALAGLHSHVRMSLILAVFVPAAAAAMVGLADDLLGEVSVRVRLAALVAVAFAGAAAVVMTGHSGPWAGLLAVAIGLWVVAYTNFFNFMDGINGIASTSSLLAGVSLGLIARHLHHQTVEAASFALAAASLGFLPFNFPRARVFLGDVGSYFSGAVLALLVSLALLRGFTLEAAVAPVGVFVADATVTLVRRILGGKPWATAHREHAYQRLVDGGWSHTLTTTVVATVIAVSSALGSVSVLAGPAARAAADAGIVLALVIYLSLPRLQTHHLSSVPLGTAG